MGPITGELAGIGIPKLLRAIADEGRTGLLNILSSGTGEEREALVYFREGDVYHTRLKGSGVRLGARLVSAGSVSKEEVETALTIQKGEGGSRRLGQILVDANYLGREKLDGIVREQMEDVVFEVLKWDSGTFTFTPEASSNEDTELEVSVENLIMEGARRFREWHTITRRIPSLDSIPRFTEESDAVEVALTPDEWSLVSRVDGSTTIHTLARQCGFTDLEAARCVFGMVSAGLLTVVLPPGVEYPSDEPGIDEMFDELERALDDAARAPRDPSVTISLAELTGIESEEPQGLIPPSPGGVDTPIPEGDGSPAEPGEVSTQKPVEEPEPLESEEPVEEPEPLESEEPVEEPEPLESEEPVEEPEPLQSEEPVEEPEPLESEEPVEEPAAQAPYVTEEPDAPPSWEEDSEAEVESEIDDLDFETVGLPGLEDLPEIADEDRLPPARERSEAEWTEPEVVGSEPKAAADLPLEPLEEPPAQVALEGPPAEVLSEEGQADGPIEVTSVARLFADLSRPTDDGPIVTTRSEGNGRDAADPEGEDEEKPPSRPEPRKIDPSIDVKSLIREFSSLDDE